MNCRSVLTRIDALRTSELGTREVQEVEKHLKTCPTCHASFDDVLAFSALIRSCVAEPARSLAAKLVDETQDGFDAFEFGGRRVCVAFSRQGIRMIDVRPKTADEFRRAYQERFSRELRDEPLPLGDRRAIEAALSGQPARRPSVDLSDLTEFEQKVLRLILDIPRAEVRSYEWVARAAGRRRRFAPSVPSWPGTRSRFCFPVTGSFRRRVESETTRSDPR